MKRATSSKRRPVLNPPRAVPATLGIWLPDAVAAHARGSPFNNGFIALQTLFTGTIAKVASLIVIVIGVYACRKACFSVGLARLVFQGGQIRA